MRLTLEPTSWTKREPSSELLSAVGIIDGLWRQAAIDFHAESLAARATGQREPKGAQRFLNRHLDQAFEEAGWFGQDGRFTKENTWLRVTFRNHMGSGSDLLDGLRLSRLEGIECACIAAATDKFLQLISPADAKGLTSYEKLRILMNEMRGVLEYPLFVGKLEPASPLAPEVERSLRRRPTDAALT